MQMLQQTTLPDGSQSLSCSQKPLKSPFLIDILFLKYLIFKDFYFKKRAREDLNPRPPACFKSDLIEGRRSFWLRDVKDILSLACDNIQAELLAHRISAIEVVYKSY